MPCCVFCASGQNLNWLKLALLLLQAESTDPDKPPEEYRLNWALQMLINRQLPAFNSSAGVTQMWLQEQLARLLQEDYFSMAKYEYPDFDAFLEDVQSLVVKRDKLIYVNAGAEPVRADSIQVDDGAPLLPCCLSHKRCVLSCAFRVA